MARIPYPDPIELTEETAEFLSRLPALNIFRMLAGTEGLLQAFTRFGNHLLYRSELNPVLRELAILRVGVLSNAAYELHQHDDVSRQLGMSEALIAAARNGPDDPVLDDLQRRVLRFTDDVVVNVRASDETFESLHQRLTPRALQELTVTIGCYMLVCRYLETFGIDIEEPGTTDGLRTEHRS
jgi:4-carboxymuconolactone decarboxylase